MSDETKKLQQLIDDSRRIVFGGAGVSTESGIPDFRSVDGLYHQKYAYPPETILSHSFFISHTAEFFDFYRQKMLCLTARPNAAHRKLAELEAAGKLMAIVTQNIDGLHQMAGSKKVYELHGSVHRNICQACGKVYDLQAFMPRIYWLEKAFPAAPAAALSNRMSYCMRKHWMTLPYRKVCAVSPKRTCSSLQAPLLPSIRRLLSSTISQGNTLFLSTATLPRWIIRRLLPSTVR